MLSDGDDDEEQEDEEEQQVEEDGEDDDENVCEDEAEAGDVWLTMRDMVMTKVLEKTTVSFVSILASLIHDSCHQLGPQGERQVLSQKSNNCIDHASGLCRMKSPSSQRAGPVRSRQLRRTRSRLS